MRLGGCVMVAFCLSLPLWLAGRNFSLAVLDNISFAYKDTKTCKDGDAVRSPEMCFCFGRLLLL